MELQFKDKIPVTNGQVQYEFKHLLKKLKTGIKLYTRNIRIRLK